jgi:2,4-dienoyl-CoA reductase-like NADH-dependent reductase (Old Yellow Enzyme family)
MLLQRIERYLRAHRISTSRFGREAVRDPNFIENLRNGRQPRPETVCKVLAYIDRGGGASGGMASGSGSGTGGAEA